MLTSLFTKYDNIPLTGPKIKTKAEDANRFKAFFQELQALYAKLCPDDKSVSNGKKRNPWKHVAIQNHMKKLNERLGKDLPEVLRDLNKRDDGCWWLTKASAKPAN